MLLLLGPHRWLQHLAFAAHGAHGGAHGVTAVASSPTCSAEFLRLCGNSTSADVATCDVCTRHHQSSLRAAGCSAADAGGLCAAVVDGPPRICAVGGSTRLVAVRGPCPDGSSRTRVAAVNIFDGMWDASSAMGSPDPQAPSKDGISIANTTAALASAAANNIRVFRMFACLWGPHMSFWVTNESAYWAEFDTVMNEIERYPRLHVILSIGYSSWWWAANQAYAADGVNETLNDFILNASSVGRGLATRYFTQIVTRYATRDCVLLWELGNELNLQVDLPPPKCGDPTAKCFGIAAMTNFTAEVVGIIRGIDPHRPISSGMGAPLPCAWHLSRCDYKTNTCPHGATGGIWGIDSKEQWLEVLAEQQAGVDYWSIHLCDTTKAVDHGCYFKEAGANGTCAPLTDVIATASSAASSAGKGFYLGEYGGPNPNFTGPTRESQAYPSAVLALQVAQAQSAPDASAFDLSTIWAYMGAWTRIAPWNAVFIFPDSNIPRESGSKAMLDTVLQADAALANPSRGTT
eukprot:COSAG03_NODE_548_length_7000_cov_2.644110_7_plen_519_part_00